MANFIHSSQQDQDTCESTATWLVGPKVQLCLGDKARAKVKRYDQERARHDQSSSHCTGWLMSGRGPHDPMRQVHRGKGGEQFEQPPARLCEICVSAESAQ